MKGKTYKNTTQVNEMWETLLLPYSGMGVGLNPCNKFCGNSNLLSVYF